MCHGCCNMQVLAEVVALHLTPSITAAQAKGCAVMTICKIAALMQPKSSVHQPTPGATPVQKPAPATPGQVFPVTPRMMFPAATPQAAHAAVTPAAATKAQTSSSGCGGTEAQPGECLLQPDVLFACTQQLASLLQHASLHVLHAASARPSDELAQVRSHLPAQTMSHEVSIAPRKKKPFVN